MSAVLFLASLFGALPLELACERDEAHLEEARAAYEAGLRDAEAGRWVLAEREFRESYEGSCSSGALFNLSAVLAAVGRLVETREVIEQLLTQELEPAVEEEARRRLAQAELEIATLVLEGLAAEPHEIVLDGEPVADPGDRPLRLSVDPRPHGLLVQRPGHEPFSWRGEFEVGAIRRLDVALVPEPTTPPPSDDAPLLGALIGALGGAALIAIVTTAVVITQPAGVEPLHPVLTP